MIKIIIHSFHVSGKRGVYFFIIQVLKLNLNKKYKFIYIKMSLSEGFL